jgi:hypothetical protein
VLGNVGFIDFNNNEAKADHEQASDNECDRPADRVGEMFAGIITDETQHRDGAVYKQNAASHDNAAVNEGASDAKIA